jgi:Protein of unknown function (DUF1553)/Protein of unknown function (DUF1549)
MRSSQTRSVLLFQSLLRPWFVTICSLAVPLIVGSELLGQESNPALWSLKALERPSVPELMIDRWSITQIDRFIFEKLQAAGIAPSPDSSPATLLRRLHFDLIGLPPAPNDIDQFLNRLAKEDFEKVLNDEVERLLEKEQFGERWGRHWLDVARFAESSGKEANISFPYAWRYRDYVIDCFNNEVPFNRFIVEQIAGDLLPYENDAERARLLNATGFLAIGPKNLDEANPIQFAADLADEQIDTVCRAFIAQSIACARCHDHKTDQYTMEDYYGLAGIFASTTTYFGTSVSPANRMGGDPLQLPLAAGQPILQKSISAKKVIELKEQLAKLKKEQEDGMAAVAKAVQEGREASEIFTLRDALRIFWSSGGIEGQLEQVDDKGKALPLTMGVLEAAKMVDATLLERGDIHQPTGPIARRLPQAITTRSNVKIDPKESGRLQMAHWLADSSHPLTARVIVNRVWHHLMGMGVVSTIDDFGITGQSPTHPELLDYLAIQFIEDSWSIKQLIRQIVLSRVYRQSSSFDAKKFEIDPDNRLRWRASKRRLDAELIRDSMLAVSGELDYRRPLGSLVATTIGDRPISLIGLDNRVPHDLDGSLNRSVYLPVLRDRLPDALAIFDFAEPSLVTGARESTNVPVQALYLMNSDFVRLRSTAFAKSIVKAMEQEYPEVEPIDNTEQIVIFAFQKCFGRKPDPIETKLACEYLDKELEAAVNITDRDEAFVRYCQALFASAEFRNVD